MYLFQDENPNVAATFYWEILNRSVRVEGIVEKLSEEESTTYFHTRPVPSQIAASTSHQSTPIESRDVLIEREKVLEGEYMIPGKEVPKPAFWYGFFILVCLETLIVKSVFHSSLFQFQISAKYIFCNCNVECRTIQTHTILLYFYNINVIKCI